MSERGFSSNARRPATPNQRPPETPRRTLGSRPPSSTPRPEAASQLSRGSNTPEKRKQQVASLKRFPSKPSISSTSKRPQFPKPTPAPPPERAKGFGDLAGEADNDSSSESVRVFAITKRKQDDSTAYATNDSKRYRTNNAVDHTRICLSTGKESGQWSNASNLEGEPLDNFMSSNHDPDVLYPVLERLSNLEASLQDKTTVDEVRGFVDMLKRDDNTHFNSRLKKVEASIQDLTALDLQSWQRKDPDTSSIDFEQELETINLALAALRQDLENKTSNQNEFQKALEDQFQKRAADLEKEVRSVITELKNRVGNSLKVHSLDFEGKFQKVQQSFEQAKSHTDKELMAQLSTLESSSQAHWTTTDETLDAHTNQISELETRVSNVETRPDKESLQMIMDQKDSELRTDMTSLVSKAISSESSRVIDQLRDEASRELAATFQPIPRQMEDFKKQISRFGKDMHAFDGRVSKLEGTMVNKPPSGPREPNRKQQLAPNPEQQDTVSNNNWRLERLEADTKRSQKAIKEAEGWLDDLEKKFDKRDRHINDHELQIHSLDENADRRDRQIQVLEENVGNRDRQMLEHERQLHDRNKALKALQERFEKQSDWRGALRESVRVIEATFEKKAAAFQQRLDVLEKENANLLTVIDKHKTFKDETIHHINKLNEKLNDKLNDKVLGGKSEKGMINGLAKVELELREVKGRLKTLTECSEVEIGTSRENFEKQDEKYEVLRSEVAKLSKLPAIFEKDKEGLRNELHQTDTKVDQLVSKVDVLETKQDQVNVQVQDPDQLASSLANLQNEQVTLATRVDAADARIDRLAVDATEFRARLPDLEERVEEVSQTIGTAGEPSQSLGKVVWNELGDDYFAQISGNEGLDAFLGKLRYMTEDIVTNIGSMQRHMMKSDKSIEALRQANNDDIIDNIPVTVLNALRAYVEKHVVDCVKNYSEQRILEHIDESLTTVADGMKEVHEREGIIRDTCIKHAKEIKDNTTSITQHVKEIKKLQNDFRKLPRVLSNPPPLTLPEFMATLHRQSHEPNFNPQPTPPHLQTPQMIPMGRPLLGSPNTPPVTPQDAPFPMPQMVHNAASGQQLQQRPSAEMIAQNIRIQPAYQYPYGMGQQAQIHTGALQQQMMPTNPPHQQQAQRQTVHQQQQMMLRNSPQQQQAQMQTNALHQQLMHANALHQQQQLNQAISLGPGRRGSMQASPQQQQRALQPAPGNQARPPQQTPVAQMLPANENADGSLENPIRVPSPNSAA